MDINSRDIKVDTYRTTSGTGFGLKSSIEVKVIHIPTGLSATSRDERSEHKNRIAATAILKKLIIKSKWKPNKHQWKCIDPGMYDDLYECIYCGEQNMESADNGNSANPESGCKGKQNAI